MSFEEIKRFINEKIFHKNEQKLLNAPNSSYKFEFDEKIDIKPIMEYLDNQKYAKEYSVSFMQIVPKMRKMLMKKIAQNEEGNISVTHDDFTLVEGYFSNEPFISVRRKNVKSNKIGQTIVSVNNYIDISTRKKYLNSNIIDLQYKRKCIKGNTIDYCSYDEDNESYCRKIKKDGIIFCEFASYGNDKDINKFEIYAQPTNSDDIIQEYIKLTGLKYIGNNANSHISNIIKSDPYISSIEVCKEDKNKNIVKQIEILELFKSKKECIVGYKPEMILLNGFDNENEYRMFRLLADGLYADNNSFKTNFEDKYMIKKITLDEIKELVGTFPFGISSEAKQALRSGVSIEKYIRTIYDKGAEKINL